MMTLESRLDGAGMARSWRGGVATAAARPGPAAPTAPCPPVKPEGHGGGIGRASPAGRAAAGASRRAPAANPAARDGARDGAEWRGAEAVIARLEEAGATLLALPSGGYSTRLRTSRHEVVRSALEGYGWQNARGESPRLRPPVPEPAAITRMDEAFAWLALIPADRYVLRRIVSARALVSPATGRHLFTWRRLALLLGCDHKAVQRWHAQGVALIVRGLAR